MMEVETGPSQNVDTAVAETACGWRSETGNVKPALYRALIVGQVSTAQTIRDASDGIGVGAIRARVGGVEVLPGPEVTHGHQAPAIDDLIRCAAGSGQIFFAFAERQVDHGADDGPVTCAERFAIPEVVIVGILQVQIVRHAGLDRVMGIKGEYR